MDRYNNRERSGSKEKEGRKYYRDTTRPIWNGEKRDFTGKKERRGGQEGYQGNKSGYVKDFRNNGEGREYTNYKEKSSLREAYKNSKQNYAKDYTRDNEEERKYPNYKGTGGRNLRFQKSNQQENSTERKGYFRKKEYSQTEPQSYKFGSKTERTASAAFRKKIRPQYTEISETDKDILRKKHYSKKKQLLHRIKKNKEAEELRLNRYIAMSGICSRRDADGLIAEGRVKVNDEIIQTVGIKVKRQDKVEVDGELIIPEKKVYLVLNKPKDFVTTVEDPLERKTVMSLVEKACKERIYPVGRLDRQTTGVLLFTNDGDLSKKLTHPKYEHKKVYHVFLDKPLQSEDMERIRKGIELEDGFIKADELNYVEDNPMEVGIEIHSGRNRIVRRIFEHFGYQIIKLDRVYFAGITKKNLPRGKWRFLTPQEVRILKIY